MHRNSSTWVKGRRVLCSQQYFHFNKVKCSSETLSSPGIKRGLIFIAPHNPLFLQVSIKLCLAQAPCWIWICLLILPFPHCCLCLPGQLLYSFTLWSKWYTSVWLKAVPKLTFCNLNIIFSLTALQVLRSRSLKQRISSSGKWINFPAFIQGGTGRRSQWLCPANSAAHALLNIKSFHAGAAKQMEGLPAAGNLGKREMWFLQLRS